MKQIFCVALMLSIMSCSNEKTSKNMNDKQISVGCIDGCEAKSKTDGNLSCKLTTPELRERKETVIASLKSQLVSKKELENGYAFQFDGSDKMIDELTEFIKTERACCDFFMFNLSVAGDKSTAWMELKGPEGAKEFITSELGL